MWYHLLQRAIPISQALNWQIMPLKKTRSLFDILVGSDNYWKLVTGDILKVENGPTAMQTRLGWVLAGPVEGILSPTLL